MFLLIALGAFFLCSVGKAIAEDWLTGQKNLQWCAGIIADAIHSGSNNIASSIERSATYITEEEKELVETFKNKQIENYTDQHGRKMRTRILYNERGIPIAEERLEITE